MWHVNLTQVIDAAGNQTKIEYNALDLPVKLTDALGHIWLRTYDTRGNLIQSTDPLGQHTRYAVDDKGTSLYTSPFPPCSTAKNLVTWGCRNSG